MWILTKPPIETEKIICKEEWMAWEKGRVETSVVIDLPSTGNTPTEVILAVFKGLVMFPYTEDRDLYPV